MYTSLNTVPSNCNTNAKKKKKNPLMLVVDAQHKVPYIKSNLRF